MNILFPIAGRGERFKSHNYNIPKPLVMVSGKTLLEHSISTLDLPGTYIFVTLKYQNDLFNKQIQEIIYTLQPSSRIISLDSPTNGMAETSLGAESFINNEEELIITNVDQYLSWNSAEFLKFVRNADVDACVSTYEHDDIELEKSSKYAFVKLDSDGNAVEFQEKFAISEHAMNGIYYWKYGKDFVDSAKKMILDNIKVNNEFYVSPSYNYMIRDGKKIKAYKMQKNEYCSLGSPEEISNSLKQPTIQPSFL